MGMVNAVILTNLESTAYDWAQEILAKSPTSIKMLKFAMNLTDDGMVGQQVFAGEAARLAYMTEEAKKVVMHFLKNAHLILKKNGFLNGIFNMQKLKYWLATARLRTLPLSVSGIIVGSSLSGFINQQFNQVLAIQTNDYYIFFGALLTTIVFQILSNFANDYGDGVKGTDAFRNEARMVSSGKISSKQMKSATILFALIGLFLTINLVLYAFNGYNLGYVFLFWV